MQIIVGKNSGFCNGVSYTIKKAEEILNNSEKTVYCLGEIVHNEIVVNELKEKGIVFVNDINEVPNDSLVIFRAHGECKEIYELAKSKNIEVFDLTCGKIRVIRNKIDKEKEDSFIVIIGKKAHPEVKATYSFCKDTGYVVENEEDIEELIKTIKSQNKNKIYINAQTTFGIHEFEYLVSKIKENLKEFEIVVDNTICTATFERQNETLELSKKVDKMIIVGGKKSSNTKELEIIAKENCDKVYLISNAEELDLSLFNNEDTIGIMGGASTPSKLIDEIIAKLSSIFTW